MESKWNKIVYSFDDLNLSESLSMASMPMVLRSPLPSNSEPFFLASRVMM
jgi:hypothetical protein